MDADDIALPHRLKEQIRFMERHPEVGLLGGAVELIGPEGQVLTEVRPPLEDSQIRLLMLSYGPFYHSTLVMRKEVVLGAGGDMEALLYAHRFKPLFRIAE